MPKAILTFRLPKEAGELRVAIEALGYASALHRIKNEVGDIWKHRDLKTEEAKQVADDMNQIVCDTLAEVLLD